MNEINCTVCHELIHGYLDHELDAASATNVAEHLSQCADCQRVHDEAQRLIASVKTYAPYYAAPDALIQQVFANPPSPTSPWQALRDVAQKWLAPAFSAVALAMALVLYVATPSPEQPWLDEAVSNHVRSLMAQHLNDVVSSDRHTVKPWFTGKLDFSPPVFDFSAQGFPLLGGRLDYLQHQTTAALSYGRAKHIINVFILPTTATDTPRLSQSIRGYNVVAWQDHHMRFIVISDLEKTELEVFSQLLEQRVF
ncbi:anti-sigma factor [Pseudomonas brassicacearum]|uniref:Anti-sigma factor n=1 Tax=Pseudomonas brassicacearum TaxID=930166 RepID=A0A423H764_9PSED|nr:anti-sigma factor [Pseudomonas brassicacearum]RON09031.1 anti-sigma factor [Pseudomonas brassicacearum]